jgi:Protein of unknown function (DUF4230)
MSYWAGWLQAMSPYLASGWALAPDQPLNEEVQQTGFMKVETTKVLEATVQSLRTENKLLVFSYKGSAKVRAERTYFKIFSGDQQLQISAVVNYYLDLSDLSLADVTYDEKAKLVRVKLPKLKVGDIAFQPENAMTDSGGILSWNDDQVEALRKLNNKTARKAMVAQAQQKGLVNAAKRQAISNVKSYFEIPLRIAGLPDAKVVATFD